MALRRSRGAQALRRAWIGGRCLPTGASHTPCLDLADLSFELSLNGAVQQSGHVNQMIFDLGFQLKYISSFAPLMPGDLIFTGTPSGVGPINRGDKVSLRWLTGPQLPPFEGVL